MGAYESGNCPDVTLFRRGDANADGAVNLSDAVYTLSYLFEGATEPPCLKAADSDDSGGVNLSDALVTLNFLYGGGSAPPAPAWKV